MELEGKVWKNKKYWLIEVPSLEVMTQGTTKEEAIEMIRDAILELIYSYFKAASVKKIKLTVNVYKRNVIGVTASDSKIIMALSLIRQREKSGSTVREAAQRLGSTSPNSYAQYEKGKTRISLDHYEKLLQAANPQKHSLLRVI